MVHTDKVVRELEFVYEGVFDFKELLSIIKEFVKRYKYDLNEKGYETKGKGEVKTTKLRWEFERKLDDYNKAVVKLKIELADYKEGHVESVKVVDGKLKIEFNADIIRDYNENWKVAPAKKFFRALFDKYVMEIKQKKVDDSVIDLVDSLRSEIKRYLKA